MNKQIIQNKIDNLIYKANHTNNFKEWQKINIQINNLKSKIRKEGG